jgi:hypothetical protein
LRGGVVPVEAAICAAEEARRTARVRSVAALFIITFRLACARIPVVVELSAECAILITGSLPGAWGPPLTSLWMSREKVSNIEHQSCIETDNMQLKNKEILLFQGCRDSGNYSL